MLATQNPSAREGTYPLREAQLDRFLFKLDVHHVGSEVLTSILLERRGGRPPEPEPATDAAGLAALFAAVDAIFLPRAVAQWIARVVEATHPGSGKAPEKVRAYVKYGASPRAAIAIGEASRAHALLAGKPNVGFDDVRAVAAHAIAHRIALDYRARLDGVTGRDVVAAVLSHVGEIHEVAR